MAAGQGGIKLSGTMRQSEDGHRRTADGFGKLIEDNPAVFRRYFGVDLFAESVKIDVPEPTTLQQNLDQGKYQTAFVIPRAELAGMPAYIGDGQAWRAALATHKPSNPISGRVIRRIGSRVPRGVIEGALSAPADPGTAFTAGRDKPDFYKGIGISAGMLANI